jgi:hypothetical protein
MEMANLRQSNYFHFISNTSRVNHFKYWMLVYDSVGRTDSWLNKNLKTLARHNLKAVLIAPVQTLEGLKEDKAVSCRKE